MTQTSSLSKFASIANNVYINIPANLTGLGTVSNTFTIGTGTYFVSNGNVGIGIIAYLIEAVKEIKDRLDTLNK